MISESGGGVVEHATPQSNANKLNYMDICFTSYLNQMVVFYVEYI